MNETIKTLTTRRSVRSYKDTPVPDDVLKEILLAGEYAPSGMNKMPAVMVVVKDKETIAKLSKLNAQIMGKDVDPFGSNCFLGHFLAHISRGRNARYGKPYECCGFTRSFVLLDTPCKRDVPDR